MNAKNNKYLITAGFILSIAVIIVVLIAYFAGIRLLNGLDSVAYNEIEEIAGKTVMVVFAGLAAAIVAVVWALILFRKRIVKYEAKLQIEKEQLGRAIEFIGEGVIALDMKQNIILLNRTAEGLTGWTQKEAFGKPFYEIFCCTRDGINVKNIATETLQADSADQNEEHYLLTAKDGTVRYIADKSSRITDLAGNPVGVVLTFRDETEKKRIEEGIRDNENRAKLELQSILASNESFGSMQLQNILKLGEIESLMMDFYKSTNVPAALFDSENKLLISTGFQDICTKFHKQNPTTLANCFSSDSQYSGKLKNGEYKLYKCLNNMWDMVTPIIVNNQFMGNLYIGQFFVENEEIDENAFRMQARKFGFDERTYMEALQKVPRFSKEKLELAMSFYVKLAGMLSILSYCNYQLASSLMKSENTKLLLKSSIENSKEMMMVSVDWEFRYLFFNHSYQAFMENLYGKKIELGKNMFGSIESEKDKMLLKSSFERAFAGESNYSVEEYGEKNKKYLEIFVNPIYNNQEEIIGVSAFSRDISERLQMERALEASEARNKSMLTNISDVVAILDAQGRCVYISPNMEERFGWIPKHEEPLISIHMIHPQDRRRLLSEFRSLLEKPDAKTTIEIRYVSRSSQYRSVLLTGVNRMNDPNIKGVLVNFHDITERKQREEEILYLNDHNALTGIYNRRYFDTQIRNMDTPGNLPLSIISGDIDGLKLINDALGHAEGDKLIIKIANILKKCVRKDDILARTGGDEFGILLPRTTNEEAQEIVKRVIFMCKEQKTKKDVYYVSISMGFATKTSEDENIGNKIKEAEDSMYKRKLLEHKSLHSSVIASIKTTMLEKSYHTEEHAQRLILLSRALGKLLGLTNEQQDDLELLSTLHDIGKIVVDDAILHKQSELTEEEWEQMKKHPDVGYRIAMASPELVSIAEYILCHHERWDGKGYPQGLSGEDIPLLSRILTVTDSYDAMTQDRPYRKAMSMEAAIDEIRKNAGKQFDPVIADLFVNDILFKKEYEQNTCA